MGTERSITLEENVTAILNSMTSRDIFKSMANAVKTAGRAGVREIKREYKKTGIKHRPDKARYDDPEKGIRFSVAQSNKLILTFTIFDGGGANSGAFKLKWFEKGTEPRYTKKTYKKTWTGGRRKKEQTGGGKYRGEIKATPFFAPAMRSLEPRILDIYNRAFNAAINRRIKKELKKKGLI
jgi:hypothetical protein